MKITRSSIFSDIRYTLDLPITQERIDNWLNSDVPTYEAFPELSVEERNFLAGGATPEEWVILSRAGLTLKYV